MPAANIFFMKDDFKFKYSEKRYFGLLHRLCIRK